MTNKLATRFTDYFEEEHLCMPLAEIAMKGVLDEQGLTDIPDDITRDGIMSTFSAQLGAFLRGYLIGQIAGADFDTMLSKTIEAMCPVCLNYWAVQRDECCIGHALLNFIEQVYTDSMQTQVVNVPPSHGDPSLN